MPTYYLLWIIPRWSTHIVATSHSCIVPIFGLYPTWYTIASYEPDLLMTGQLSMFNGCCPHISSLDPLHGAWESLPIGLLLTSTPFKISPVWTHRTKHQSLLSLPNSQIATFCVVFSLPGTITEQMAVNFFFYENNRRSAFALQKGKRSTSSVPKFLS